MKIPDKVRFVNKKFTNHLMMPIAGRKCSPIAILRHFGRRSGRQYAIPILTAPEAGGFIFALTYGDQVDWYRNILAAGYGVLKWRGMEYQLISPSIIPTIEGRSAFPQPWRFLLSVMRTADFFRMTIQ